MVPDRVELSRNGFPQETPSLRPVVYEALPNADMTPREAYARLVAGDVESVSVDKLANRTAANAIMPYPPGIPMLMSGENFGGLIRRRSGIYVACRTGRSSFPASRG